MCLVLYGWLSEQEYWKEITNSNIRKEIQSQQAHLIEEDLTPFGFINDGRGFDSENTPYEVIDWETGERVF